ncbi:hypothetical protein [Varunaivibrio sulfuroxidans]|uniref:Uncharacterized protein n=1 Tax=Varunaivibrio sulfuroxidans TaxID=1773489 RepID=A0A4R3JGJ4_9PROT|nr:hypothetical protein [Varunaivibrio sulfuroxidans]TCS65017.1 hypothetical protein EDD55_101350 [Varunaivibrio sulfuroxidans]WES29693.1 hypothetical protein P3M64_08515 [Varunaivibrio sulfuroxidans]
MRKIDLSLDPEGPDTPPRGETSQHGRAGRAPNGDGPRQDTDKSPVLGWFAVAFGVLGVFTWSVIFVPLALICGVIALFVGQVFWGVSAIVLAVIATATSPFLLMTLGLGAMAAFMHMGAPAM